MTLLQFDYASAKFKRLPDGSYSARLHRSAPNPVITVRFPEAGLAYLKGAGKCRRVRATGRGSKVAIGGTSAYCVYGRPYADQQQDANVGTQPESAYWLVGRLKITRMGGVTYYQW